MTEDNNIEVNIIKIGNSKGIRIPNSFLESCGLGPTAHLKIENNKLILSPIKKFREGWDEAFKTASIGDTEEIEDEYIESEWDKEEWTW